MQLINRNSLYQILKTLLDQQIAKAGKKQNLTVCFDIDGTIYDPYSRRPIFPIMNFYKYCQSKNLRVIIITARVGLRENAMLTKSTLRPYGVYADEWYFMNNFINNQIKYKRDMRQFEEERGNNIIMSLGDNVCDIGKHGGLGVLVRESHAHGQKYDPSNIFYQII